MTREEHSFDPLVFWAKTTHDPEGRPRAYHPLLCHLLDVAAVASLMWDEVLPAPAQMRLARALGLAVDEAGRETARMAVAFIAGLHDLGKASPPFTLREDSPSARSLHTLLAGTGYNRPRLLPKPGDAPHGYVTAEALPDILISSLNFPKRLANQIGVVVGGHHGLFPRSHDLINLYGKTGDGSWAKARRRHAEALAATLGVPGGVYKDGALDHPAAMFLAGLVSVADWIGSNADYFGCYVGDFDNPPRFDPAEYFEHARAQARKALEELRWLGWPRAEGGKDFAELFPRLTSLRPVQQAAVAVADRMTTPGVVIVEAPMGEGKTEAAMFLADCWSARLGQRGMYFALPTQATSNQMFGRVKEFLEARFEGDVLVQLLHGHAALSAEFETLLKRDARPVRLTDIHQDGDCCEGPGCDGRALAGEWFTHRKRGLLAPFGVGTVDQALLAVLQTRHVFVRLFGLAHKTIIVDEVHAYDAYMSKLLERLLEWLAALGSPVILLSATLPTERRRALLAAYRRGLGMKDEEAATETEAATHYPRLSWATATEAGEEQIAVSPDVERTLRLEWVDGRLPPPDEDFALGVKLKAALVGGGCAAVICNTVNRAQQVYAALKLYFAENELDLFHARYLFDERERREDRTLKRFGKTADHLRPPRFVLVATQVVEQSLDLDFDLMVTDLAPADLILQRSGRLQRHARPRPEALAQAALWVCLPEEVEHSVPRFDGGTEAVYDAHILLRSWLALGAGVDKTLSIPRDIEPLVESVYDGRECPATAGGQTRRSWEETRREMKAKLRKMEATAAVAIVPPPTYEDDISEAWNKRLEEDEPEIHASLQALTRLSDPTVSVVCLRPHEQSRCDTRQPPALDTTRELLRRSVTISHRGLTRRLLQIEPPTAWRRSPLLRRHRLLELDAEGAWRDDEYFLADHTELGIIVSKISKET